MCCNGITKKQRYQSACASRRDCGSLVENILFSESEQKRLFFFASPRVKYLFYEEIQKKIFFQGQFAEKRISFSRIMAEIPNRGVKSTKKLSDSIKKQEKDHFIFCGSQKMNLFEKNKEKRYFRPAGALAGCGKVRDAGRREYRNAGRRECGNARAVSRQTPGMQNSSGACAPKLFFLFVLFSYQFRKRARNSCVSAFCG